MPASTSWEPTMAVGTTSSNYWLNWRVLLCSIWILVCMVVASILIWRYEGPGHRSRSSEKQREGLLYDDEAWRPCLKEIHPAWLLAFRLVSFFILLGLLIVIIIVDGGSIFFYYTQWTFVLVTCYFGLGSLLSIYGCHQYLSKEQGNGADLLRSELERGMYLPSTGRSSNSNPNSHMNKMVNSPGINEEREIAGFWGYIFQVIYQTNAGAVMLTDCVFWFIIFPFLTIRDYDLNFLLVGMHSVNAVFLLGDTALNSLRFPWFRIAYFFLWTSTYVIFQWIIHACVPIWWPYPFLDLSSSRAPLWYLLVALMQIPCYAVLPLLIKLKYYLLERWFPASYYPVK
ncbi:hypothetical protein LUZ61_012559 [Rhynchospora tenuis]|uniref:Uncharacterized protein n=1 Tax=Rhynchospora tenuis TaxID=198213 RepID=A0AAD6A3C6_9POAL|nr:hypothetical protein LUZ61_012559 [Rhynchospora tenuis]